jgi:hypothetical protein
LARARYVAKTDSTKIRESADALANALARFRHLRGERVFYDDAGQQVTEKILRGWLAAVQRRAGLPITTGALHILRHTFCSHLAMRGAPPRPSRSSRVTGGARVGDRPAEPEGSGPRFWRHCGAGGPGGEKPREIVVEAPGIEPPTTSAPCVVDRGLNDADHATQGDAKRREVSALSAPSDAVETALSYALHCAAEAGRFDVVAQLARELEARRLSRAGNVVTMEVKARQRGA